MITINFLIADQGIANSIKEGEIKKPARSRLFDLPFKMSESEQSADY